MKRTFAWIAVPLAFVAQPLAAQVAEQGAFVILVGRDTFAVENFSRTPYRLEGEMTGRVIGRIAYTALFGPGELVRELTLHAWAAGAAADAAPMQEAVLTLQDDSVVAVITTAERSTTQRIASHDGALLYVNPSFALTEQMVRRALVLGGEAVAVPVFISQGGQTFHATIRRPSSDSVFITLATSEMHGSVTGDGRLLGLSIPAQNLTVTRVDDVHVAAPAAETPDYAAPPDAPYTAEEVFVPTPAGHTLGGTLTRPRSNAVVGAVVMITGSGAQDRDQAIPSVHGYRPFRDIADTLSRRNVAVLRLDDRGFGASSGDFAAATSSDFADDVRAALAYLRARPDIDARRTGLIGHSEGALIAPMVAATDTLLAAIVLIAGPAQTGREIITFQQRQAVERAATLSPEGRDSLLADLQQRLEQQAATQPWLRFFLDYDPLSTARRVRRTPVLILHGETDRQVTVEQADALASAFRAGGNADVSVHRFADVNHLLLPDADGDPAGYAALEARRVAREVLGTLVDWTSARLR
jgi:uncharacterized protein